MEETHEMWVWSLGGEDSLEKENGNALQYYYQESPVDRGDWWATIHGATKSQKWLSSWAYTHTNNRLAPCPTPNSLTLPSSADDWLADTEVQEVGSLGSQQDQLCSVLMLQRTCGTRLQLVANRDLIITCVTHCSTHSPEHTPPLQKKPHFCLYF